MLKTDILVCGAGIAGISAAYYLGVKNNLKNILLVDARDPLSLTSDKSTEAYRNWWPGPGTGMISLMNRSIDHLEQLAAESGNVFSLNRRGYLYVTCDPQSIPAMQRSASEISALGGGPVRLHLGNAGESGIQFGPPDDYRDHPEGADLILDSSLLHQNFPYLSSSAVAALFVRRAGWFSAQQLGMYLLDKARAAGVTMVRGHVTEVEVAQNQVRSVLLSSGEKISTPCFINAAGPLLKDAGRLLGVDLPVHVELHLKASIRDTLGAVPRLAPLIIYNDPQYLEWSDEERTFFQEDPSTRHLLSQLPAGAHTRPEGVGGSQTILLLWEYQTQALAEPVFPVPYDVSYTEMALRGLSPILPGLKGYLGRLPQAVLDGGYYTRTPENRPLIGRLPVQGAYVIGALSGYGLMAACAAGELLAAHVCEAELPAYASDFSLERYADPAYQAMLTTWGDTGQL